MKRTLLIATSNPGKFQELKAVLETGPLSIVSLQDLDKKIAPPDETGVTLEENAILKAKYYAEQSGLPSLTDDAGLFIDALGGWPGVVTARIAPTDVERWQLVLDKMKDIPEGKRSAHFGAALCLYDPENNSTYVSTGSTSGEITRESRGTALPGLPYDQIFLVSGLGKTYAELTPAEKNGLSHRGKAVKRMEYHLKNTYGAKNIVVPFALIIKDGKLLMQLRNDPHRPEYHQKWEFPGGGVDFGETMHDNVKREVKEEVGYEVEIVRMLQHIAVETQVYPTFQYQVFLVPYVCKIVGGQGVYRDEEVLDVQWFDLDDVLNHELIGENARMFRIILPELREVINVYNLSFRP